MGPTGNHDIAAQTVTEPPPCFTVGGFLGCCPNVNSSSYKEKLEG
jgi:hypothetical protein